MPTTSPPPPYSTPSLYTKTANTAQSIIPTTTPVRVFEAHEDAVCAVAVFPDRQRMVTGSKDKSLRLWNLKNGTALNKLEGHRSWVQGLAVSRDGQLIASGGLNGELIAWNGETGERLTLQPIQAHKTWIRWIDFSPDRAHTLATGSSDTTTRLWNTTTWQVQKQINCGGEVFCVQYSPSGGLLAIATSKDIRIWDTRTMKFIANFEAHAVKSNSKSWNVSLAWTPDGTRLLSGGASQDPTIREWDTSTWKQVGVPWTGHSDLIYAIAVNSNGTLVASASHDKHVRLWRLSDRRTIAIFEHANYVLRVTFSMDGKHILSAGKDTHISKWAIPEDMWPDSKLLTLNTTIRNAFINRDLSTAEALLTQAINADANFNYISYANRSFLMAQKLDWNRALQDARMSLGIHPSLTGCISEGIALCGQNQIEAAMKAFDLAFMFTDGDSKIIHLLLLIKAIALFNADHHEEAILRVQGLGTICPSADTRACRMVEAYLHVQLGINALNDTRHDDAAGHFAAAVNTNAFSSKSDIHSVPSVYEDFAVLFGWDLESLWRTANQNLCDVLLCAGRLEEAHKSYRYMIDMSDEITKASCLDWSTDFKQKCSRLYGTNGDAALAASDFDRAIEQYSAAIELDSTTDKIFANRSRARLAKMLWEDALLDAQKTIELSPSSHLGYQLKLSALSGAKRHDEAIEVLNKLGNAPKTQITRLDPHYVNHIKAGNNIHEAIHAQLDDAPLRLLNTSTGRICNRGAQINAFKSSGEYKELLSFTMMHADRKEHIQDVVAKYFRCAMLSHRWQEMEPQLTDIQDKPVDELKPVGGIVKLQSFCRTARNAGYLWGWIDTCCIDQTNSVEVQTSLQSMFGWYRSSALTMVYLSDVPPSSESGALARSAWNTRGWTVPEFLAPRHIRFYQKDWTLYLDDPSPNHKDSIKIMQELEDSTGIDARALVAFQPGMKDARQKLRWVSTRVTTKQEDVAYSLFGVFAVQLSVRYGEQKQSALGRLLQEIIGQSGDITALDWVGKPSKFNSCLPADITSYKTPPHTHPSLSDDELHKSVSSLRDAGAVQSALALRRKLHTLPAARFGQRRLHLPCIAFPVTEVRQRLDEGQETYVTYEVKATGLRDLLITTDEKLSQFSPTRPTRQKFVLVYPWGLLEWSESDFPDGTQPGSPADSELQALRLTVRLGQQFSAFLLLKHEWREEYRRVASDHNIIAQVNDVASVHSMMDIRTVEIL